jgi:hypothetical protein
MGLLRAVIGWFFRWGEHASFARELLDACGLWEWAKITIGSAIVTLIGVALGKLGAVPAQWLWVGGVAIFIVTMLVLFLVLAREALKDKRGRFIASAASTRPTNIEKTGPIVVPTLRDDLPDVRVADNPRVCRLFESNERDKLFPLMEAEKLTVWARPMKGDDKLLHLQGHTWRTHFFMFLPKQGEQTRHQTFVKTQAGQQLIWFDVHFNQKQIESVWPELEWIPILTAAQIAYEAMESSGLEGVITSPGQTATDKLTFFIDMMTSREDREIQLRGRKSPSTVLRPIPREEFPHLHLIPNTNNLGSIIASEPARYNDVEIIRADLNDHISWLHDIANEDI